MHTHEHYEELCALAATGQIEERDLSEFHAHLLACMECRTLIEEFAEIGSSIVSTRLSRPKRGRVPSGLTERFLARAHSNGIDIDSAIAIRPPVWKFRTPAFTAVAILLLAISATVFRFAISHDKTQQRIAMAGQTQSPFGPTESSNLDQRTQMSRIASLALDAARAQEARLTAQLKLSREELDKANNERQKLVSQLATLQDDHGKLEAKARDRDVDFDRLRTQLDRLNAERIANEVAVATSENELRALRDALATKEATLQQQQHLISVGNQARDLIVARNLHIIDVYDRDGDGNRQKPFGRVFYTEGKSLIFYAYDLAPAHSVNQKISFYAWGESLEGNQPVKSLGIFHSDDSNQGRWALSFDDHEVLAKIDSVFVTVEQDKRPITHPNGKKILFAFLGNRANHP